jgi:hypothetical protein
VEVKLTIGATSDEAKLKFLHALEQSPSFSHLEVLNQKVAQQQPGSNDKVDVELSVVYSRA